MKLKYLLPFVGLAAAAQAVAGTATISIDLSKKGPQLNPKFYGIFLEEINHGVDGGLYAEMVRNRAFENNTPPEGSILKNGRWFNKSGWDTGFQQDETGLPNWHLIQTGSAKGSMKLSDEGLNKNTRHALELEIDSAGGRIGVWNEGFWGINIVKGEKYNFSLYTRCANAFNGPLSITLEDDKGTPCTKPVSITGIGPGWKQFKTQIIGTETNHKARLVITAQSTGTLWLDFVSLMPAKTWHGMPLRSDIAQMIADMNPSFVRFPGGCVVEGGTTDTAYDWKKTIGPLEQRQEIYNCWGYRRTHGFGFLEYLEYIEAMQAEPLFVAFAGETCYFRCSELSPMENTPKIAQQYMDAIEYTNGPASSTWGAKRAASGRAKPFGPMLLGIGNENWLQPYVDRYKVIYKTIKDKYPNQMTIACTEPNGVKIDMVDNHHYCSPRWFFNETNYSKEKYPRTKRDGTPRAPVYLGEIATYSGETAGGYNMMAGLSEAAYMLHLEENADIVKMVSYAPLIANADGRTGWHGCINFNTYQIFGTPSYWVQRIYSKNRPTYTTATDIKQDVMNTETLKGRVAIQCIKLDASFKDLKVEKDGKVLFASDFSKDQAGWDKNDQWTLEDGAWRTKDYGWAAIGDQKWENCTVSVKMKWSETNNRDAGAFSLHFATAEGNNDNHWKIDSDGRNSVVIAGDNIYPGGSVNLEKGVWHEMKVEQNYLHIRCLLDGKVVKEFDCQPVQKFMANSGYDEKTGEVIIKVVNSYSDTVKTTLNLTGLKTISPAGQVLTFKAKSLYEKNSFENPLNIIPVPGTFNGAGSSFSYEFPPCSLTVLRIKAK